MAALYIDNVQMPPVRSLSITKEKLWAPNTGRTANGTMVGDLIAIKTKAEITFVPLTGAQVATVDAAVSVPFFTVTIKDPSTNTDQTFEMYANSPSYQVGDYNGSHAYDEVKLSLIEV